jgi:SAM-dependent methyltransferase
MDSLAAFVTAAHWHAVDLIYEQTLPGRVIGCPVCGHHARREDYQRTHAECRFGGGTLERYACPRCDLVFGPMKMLDLSDAMLAADYRLLYDTYAETDSLESEIRAFRSTAPMHGGTFLNWGCGAWSETIDTLRGEGWDVWGYEPSVPSSSPFVVQHQGQISAEFDGIFSNNVIEHFRDPVAEFRAMASHLRHGGFMTHATPCYQLRYSDTRFHTAFFLGRSVDVLAERAGLVVERRETDAEGEYEAVTFSRASDVLVGCPVTCTQGD